MMKNYTVSFVRTAFFGVVAAFLFATFPAKAELDDVDTEFRFLSSLISYGFPDFADRRLREVEARYPAEKDRLQMMEAQILIARHKFEEAEKIAASMPAGNPKADAVRLSLANALYSLGETERADVLYNDFFNRYKDNPPEDEDLLLFYQESAYRLVQMRESIGDFFGAAKAYELLLKTNPPEDVQRRVQIELAEIYLKKAEKLSGAEREAELKKAEDVSSAIRWGNYDLWFGRSISITAMVEVMRGDRGKAQKLIKDYMKDLKQIDKALSANGISSSLSPMAGARYLLGKLYQEDYDAARLGGDVDEAKRLIGLAMTEYANVFAKYPGSDWGPDAGLRLAKLKEEASQIGKVEQEGSSEILAENVTDAVYNSALNLFRKKEYESAIQSYLEAANQYPEADPTIKALGNLMLAYAYTDQPLMARVVAAYLAERFPKNEFAAVNVLRMAKNYFDEDKPEDYFWYYDLYVANFTEHEKVPQILFTLANLSGKRGDVEREQMFLDRLIKTYPESQYSNKAVSKQAFDLYKRGLHAEAIPSLARYMQVEQPGMRKAQGMLALADSLKQTGQETKALKIYDQLIKTLTPVENNPYRGNVDEEGVLDVLEKASFFMGLTLQKLTVPDAQLAAVRNKAVEAYEHFLKSFPSSDLAPTAMRGIGTLQLELGDTKAAAETFGKIAETYPDSQEGKDSFFLLVDSLIEIGRDTEAREAFAKMMSSGADYSPAQYARIGNLMLGRNFNSEALKAYQAARKNTDDPGIDQRALYGIGQAASSTGDYQSAADALSVLMEKYPNTALYYDAKFLMATAYRELNQFDQAGEQLRDIFKFAPDAWQRNKASVALALLQEADGDDNGALASYLRVALLADASDPESRSYVQQALLQGLDLAQRMERWEDAKEFVEKYLTEFSADPKVPELRKVRNQINLRLQASL